jgi:hypothetical protein
VKIKKHTEKVVNTSPEPLPAKPMHKKPKVTKQKEVINLA